MTASDSKHQRDQINAKKAAAAASAAAALCTMLALGLQWKLPILTMPSLESGKFRASEVVFVERTPAAAESSRTERHLVEKSSFSAPSQSEESAPIQRKQAERKPIKTSHVQEKTSPKPSAQKEKSKQIKKSAPVQTKTRRESTRPQTSPSAPIAGSSSDRPEGKGQALRRDGGVDAGSSRTAVNEALAMLTNEVNRNKRYPRRARQIGAEGTVVLGINIDSSGRVSRVFVAQSAGFRQLDRAAEKAAETLIGMQVPINEEAVVRLPVRFMLKS